LLSRGAAEKEKKLLYSVIKKEFVQDVKGGVKSYCIEDFSMAQQKMDAVSHGGQSSQNSAENREARAYEKGFSQGLLEGGTQARDTFGNAAALLAQLAHEVAEAKESFLNKTEEDLVVLSLAIAREIINQEVKTNPDIVKAVAKEAIAQLIDKEGVTIRVNPRDFDVIKASESEMGGILEGKDRCKFLSDDFISRGGCVIESKTGIVDADLDTQFGEIWRRLLNKGE